MQWLLRLGFGLIFIPCVYAESLTFSLPPDSIPEKEPKSLNSKDSIPWPNPRKAWQYSALIPGTGQLYNRSYWKVPIIYAGLGTFTYLILKQHSQYLDYRLSYLVKREKRINADPFPDNSLENVKSFRDFHRETRDMLVLFGTFCYALQIIEAYVDAHMKHFNVTEELTLRVDPIWMQDIHNRPMAGLQAGFTF
jgi:hypothetical protein